MGSGCDDNDDGGSGNRFPVRPFEPNEWRIYRSIRLEALREAPNAFAMSYEESAARGDAKWLDRLKEARPDQLPLAVFEGDRAVGLCWVLFADPDPATAHLIQMWVALDVRGFGLSRSMLLASIEWARENNVERMVLGVTQGGIPARRFYESMGFRAEGPSEPSREGSTLRIDNMSLVLTPEEVVG